MLRRSLLAAAPALALSYAPKLAAQSAFLLGRKWNVVIIGSGLAGLSAAISAKENRAQNVLVIEKLPILGGHTRLSSGSFCAVSPKRLAPYDIHSTVEGAVEECLKIGGPTANRELLTILMKQSESAMDWLADMGIQWNRPYLPVGSESIYGFSSMSAGSGLSYILRVNERARELGVKFLLEHSVTDILHRSESNEVEGVVIKTKDGKVLYIRSDAVVLACGGYSSNLKLCQTFCPDVSAHMRSTANPTGRGLDGAGGDALFLTAPLKAKLVDLQHIQLICYLGGRLLNYVGADIYVNAQGKRFVNEGASHNAVREALLKQTANTLWAVTDSKSRKAISLENKLLDHSVERCATLQEAAKIIGCSSASLEETLNRYNEFVAAGIDRDFGKTNLLQKIDTPPYYVGREKLGIHYCCGGVAFNAKAQVLNTSDKPIHRLYVAGEASGGMHGRDRIGGGALLECVVFGRIAGREAAFCSSGATL